MDKNVRVNVSLIGSVNVVIFLAFYFAKIFDKIDWSWWWVFSPLWIPLATVLGLLSSIGIIYLILYLIALCKF